MNTWIAVLVPTKFVIFFQLRLYLHWTQETKRRHDQRDKSFSVPRGSRPAILAIIRSRTSCQTNKRNKIKPTSFRVAVKLERRMSVQAEDEDGIRSIKTGIKNMKTPTVSNLTSSREGRVNSQPEPLQESLMLPLRPALPGLGHRVRLPSFLPIVACCGRALRMLGWTALTHRRVLVRAFDTNRKISGRHGERTSREKPYRIRSRERARPTSSEPALRMRWGLGDIGGDDGGDWVIKNKREGEQWWRGEAAAPHHFCHLR